MLINSPSNPTGRAYSPSTVSDIVEFCSSKGIVLISDEIYTDLYFSPCVPEMSAFKQCKGEACVIMTAGLSKVSRQWLQATLTSKTYSVGGWRLGYAVLPDSNDGRAIFKTLVAYASECWSTASAPVQKAAIVALQRSPAMDAYREAALSLHRHVTMRLYDALCSLGLDVAEPQGGFYVYPSFNPYAAQLRGLGVYTSMDLSRWLIEKWSIATLPGSAHGEDDDGVAGGRLRLKMATSCLYFRDENERFRSGYELLSLCQQGKPISLPLLDEAIQALGAVVDSLRTI
jgi:aspartate aminotransferase